MKMELPLNYNILTHGDIINVREEYMKRQNNLCYYCKEPLLQSPAKIITDVKINKDLFPRNFFNYPIHLHHNHKTGDTIGAVHNLCNAVLWEIEGE